MNSLTQFQRYQLYDQLKQLKTLINLYKRFDTGISVYLATEQKDIYSIVKELLEMIQLDFDKAQGNLEEKLIWDDFKKMVFKQQTQILKKTQQLFKRDQKLLLKEIIDFVLKLIDFNQWNRLKVLSCKLCSLKNANSEDFFKHMIDHLEFVQLYDANMGRCMDNKCKSKKNFKNQEFSLRKHTLETHSKCYQIERPLRYCVINNVEEYGNNWKQYQYFKKDITDTLNKINQQYQQEFSNEYASNKMKGAQKEMHFKLRIKDAISQMHDEWREDQMGELDFITIYLTTTWRKLFEDPLMILEERIPMLLKKLFASKKLPYYNQQLRILDELLKGSQLESLKIKLFLGYFNCMNTFGELEYLIKDFQEGLYGIAICNSILSGKIGDIKSNCLFNEILCEEKFDNIEQTLKHYCKYHTGIITCIANENCRLNMDQRIDTWFEHCHDQHKEDFVTLIQKYLKQQKTYFQFKSVCNRCQIKLQNLTEVYWEQNQCSTIKQWKVNIRVRWSDLLKSYMQEKEIEEVYMEEFSVSYERFKKNILEAMNSKIAYNNEGKIAVCKNCKNKKKYQMAHLKKEQFINGNATKLFPLVKIEGRITKKGSDTFFRVMGNLNALKEKPHIFFAGTDIIYQWNSTQAKKQFKCRLMDKSQAERTDYVNACQNHNFLINHTYQMTDLTQQLLRQEQQILEINKNLWLRYLEKENVSDAKDKLQLEFAKMQDMLLFDGLLHKTSVIFVCNSMKKPFRSLIRKLRQFIDQQEERIMMHPLRQKCEDLLQIYETECTGQNRLFWEVTMMIYLICEQQDDTLLDFQNGNSLDSLQELLLLNRESNIFGDWFRTYSLVEVRSFVDYAIHPIYIALYYQKVYQRFEGKNQLNQNQRRIIQGIIQTQSMLTINVCLINHGYTLQDQNNTFFQSHKDQLRRQEEYVLYEMLDYLDDQQFIDMQGRIAIVSKAIEDFLTGRQIEEIMPSDLRWTVQVASIFLSSLKAQVGYFNQGKDRELRKQHLTIMKGLQEEIEYFYARNNPVYNQDFLTTNYRELILEIVQNEIFPINQQGGQMRQYTNDEIERLSKYENLRKLHFVFWLPVEQKLRNLLTVHKTIRELVDKEPYFQMSQQMNVTTFYKELEYAMFPHLYPNAQGGLITKAPDPKYFQLMVDLIEQDRLNAPQHLQQIGQIRQQINRRQIDRNQIINSNDLEIEIQLVDFNVREQFGNTTYKPTKAIYKFLKQPIINTQQSLAHILGIQELAPLQYEQLRLQLEQSNNQEFRLPEIANVYLRVNNQIGSQSILENHVSQNLDKYLSMQKRQWDNEQQQFMKKQESEVKQLKKKGRTNQEIEGFLMMQKKVLIETKIKQLAQENSLNTMFNTIRARVQINLDESVTTSESEEEERERERENQQQRALEQVNQFNRRILDDVQGRQQQLQIIQPQQIQQIQRRDVQEIIDLDRQKVDLSVDTKFKLKCSFTENFQKDHKWILWRYYEWIKSQFYCYQKVVNKEKGVMVYQEGEMKKFTSIPPICGSETELQQKYKELRAYCFQEGPPLIMLTITANEFDEKTFKIMRGLNFFDLENDEQVITAEKKITRDDDINNNANLYVEYYIYLVENLIKVIRNKFKEQKNPRKNWDEYENGLFGKIKAILKRIEFQDRGSIHFHILLFLQSNEEGLFDEKLLLYIKGILSCLRMDKQKDKEFIEKYQLQHRCNATRCTKADDMQCKDGFPFKITKGYVNANYPIEIKQRRLTNEDSNVISTWNLLVKFFNSNVQLLTTADERIISYLMKYLNKQKTKQEQNQNQNEDNNLLEEQDEEEKQLMDLIKQFYKDKITHLQEACLAFQSVKIVEATYKVVKINQIPFSRQQQNSNELLEELTQDSIQEQFEWKNKSNTWNRYMRRPTEFEHFNFMEYSQLCIYYGRKQNYIKKYNKERENRLVKMEDYKYFLDQDGCVIKLKELKEYKTTVLVKTLLHSTIEYEGNDNIYYLEMLQLYWPHRFDEWIDQTRDDYNGFKQAFQRLVNTYEYPNQINNPIAEYFRRRYCKFGSNPLKNYAKVHDQITTHQKRMLEVLYRFKFNLMYGENNQNNLQSLDFLFQLKQLLRQQLDVDVGYWRVNQIKEILDVFNPQIENADQELLNKANQLLEDLQTEVKEYWKELPQNTKNIISGMAQLYRHYGCAELHQLIKNYNEKGVVSKSKAKRQELYLYQQYQSQGGEINEDGEMEIPVSKPNTQTTISEEIQTSQILQEKLEDFHIKFESHFKNKLTIDEYNKSKVQKKLVEWNLDCVNGDLQECFSNLNIEQRLAFLMMINNLTLTLKDREIDRRFEGTFIHGPGGVGKSYIITTIVKFAQNFNLTYDILCPTQFAVQNLIKMCSKIGVKEANIQTIHSFLKLKIHQGIKTHIHNLRTYLAKQGVFNFNSTTEIYQKFMKFKFINFQQLIGIFRDLDLLIIEEVSMMDPDFLTVLDIYAQISRQCAYPFGGIQVFLFGDSFQLQPVNQGRNNYFDSHVLKNGYFSHMIELTQSVRQADDLEYYEKILQPIRLGTFGEDATNFYDQIQKLERRVIPGNIFGPNQNIKQELEEKQKEHKQVISLYFKNENVEGENQSRALKIIKIIDEKRLKRNQNDKKRFRQYINQPIQFRWSNQKTEDDRMALLLGQRFEFNKEVYDANFSHQTHYLMLPIGIRNYLANYLGGIAYRIATKQGDINKTVCLKNLTLFEKEEIVIRKNIEKQENLINGQFAVIKDLMFDVDFMNPYNMRQLEKEQLEYIKARNYFNMIIENKKENVVRFSETDKKEMRKYLEENNLMNINYLHELDVHQSEKGFLYLEDVEPRLEKINLKINEGQMTSLEMGNSSFDHEVNVEKCDFIRTLQELEDSLTQTLEFVRKTMQYNPRRNQAATKIKQWLMENGELELFGIDYLNGEFSLEYLERSLIHLKFLIQKMPNVCKVYISQLPINLGYARTIHCAQGSTFDNVIIDLDMPERQQSGLLYTALSRVRRISNLYLNGKLDQNMFKVRVSKEIKKFYLENIVEVPKYLENEQLKDLLNKDIKEILETLNLMSSDIRQGLIQLKLGQEKVQNH